MCQICALAGAYRTGKPGNSLALETKLSTALFSRSLIERVNLQAQSLDESDELGQNTNNIGKR